MRGHDFGKMDIETLPKFIKDKGFDTVQLAPPKAIEGINSWGDMNLDIAEKIRKSFEKADLAVSVFGCYIEPSLLDKEERLSQVEIFKKGITYAKEIGAPYIGTETTSLSPSTKEEEREAVYKLLKDSVLRMVEVAEKEEVDIAIEPVADHTLNDAKITRRLLDEVNSKRLKIIFDPFNLLLHDTINIQNDIYKNLFTLCREEICVMHMKGLRLEAGEKDWDLLDSLIDYNYIFKWLHEHKPNIPVLREHIKLDSYKKDLEFIRRMI